jgi:hypothetical protein
MRARWRSQMMKTPANRKPHGHQPPQPGRPTQRMAFDQREDQGHDGEAEQADADEIVLQRRMAGGPGDQVPAGDDREDAERDIDQEDRAPVEIEEVGADQQATDDRAGDGGEAGTQTEQRERLTLFFGWEGDLGNGEHLRGHAGAGEALQHPRHDQPFDRGGEAAEGRGEREGGHADEEHAGATDDVAEPPQRQEAQREAQYIGGDDPFDLGRIGAEILLQAGQRDVDDGDVDEIHEAGEQQHGERHPAAGISVGLRLRHVKLRRHGSVPGRCLVANGAAQLGAQAFEILR